MQAILKKKCNRVMRVKDKGVTTIGATNNGVAEEGVTYRSVAKDHGVTDEVVTDKGVKNEVKDVKEEDVKKKDESEMTEEEKRRKNNREKARRKEKERDDARRRKLDDIAQDPKGGPLLSYYVDVLELVVRVILEYIECVLVWCTMRDIRSKSSKVVGGVPLRN